MKYDPEVKRIYGVDGHYYMCPASKDKFVIWRHHYGWTFDPVSYDAGVNFGGFGSLHISYDLALDALIKFLYEDRTC